MIALLGPMVGRFSEAADFNLTPDLLIGPFALTIVATFAAGYLFRLHEKARNELIVDLRAQRDVAVAGWREQTAATNAVAAAIEARNLQDRLDDAAAARTRARTR